MQPYQPMQNYLPYQQPPFQDRLSQLQSNYQQAINSPQLQSAPQQQVNQGLLWVSGEVGAKSYLVAPNSTVLLMDSDSQRFYLKSADNAGMPSMRIFEYKEISNAPQESLQALNLDENTLSDKFVTRGEYEGLKKQYASIMDRLETLTEKESTPKLTRTKSKGATSDEQSDI